MDTEDECDEKILIERTRTRFPFCFVKIYRQELIIKQIYNFKPKQDENTEGNSINFTDLIAVL